MNFFFFLSFLAEHISKCLQGSHFWKELWGGLRYLLQNPLSLF